MIASLLASSRLAAAQSPPPCQRAPTDAPCPPQNTPPPTEAPPPPAEASPAPEAESPPAFPATVAPPSATAKAPALKYTVKPYGMITTELAWLLGNSSNNPDIPEWAVAGADAFYYTARQTRFGLRASWITPESAMHVQKADALIEADFDGAFVGQGIGYFFPLPRLRLATATVEWSSVRLSVGQDWAVLAPLIPETALHTAVPGFTASGNLWARIPQIRLDGAIGHDARLIWAIAAVASVQADATPTDQAGIATVRIPQGGELSLAPAGEARVAYAQDLFGKPFEVGLSGHIGDRKIPFVGGTTRELNGAIAVDLTLPLPAHLALRGEGFWGKGLDAFFGGIAQGIAHTTDTAGNITSVTNSIAAFGGWAQLSWGPLAWLKAYVGAGTDKPKRGDLLEVNATTNRTMNTAAYAELSVEVAKGFVFWFEYDFMRTTFQAAPTIKTHVVSLTGQVTF